MNTPIGRENLILSSTSLLRDAAKDDYVSSAIHGLAQGTVLKVFVFPGIPVNLDVIGTLPNEISQLP